MQADRRSIVILPALLLALGCGREAVELNSQVAATQAKVAQIMEQFGGTLRPMLKDGEPVTAAQLEEAYARLLHQFEGIQAAATERVLPTMPGAEELRKAQTALLSFQEKLLKEELPKVVRIASDKALSAEALHQRLLREFQALKDKEQAHVAAFQEAQRQFAAANGLKLE
jgi:hypothetical protein